MAVQSPHAGPGPPLAGLKLGSLGASLETSWLSLGRLGLIAQSTGPPRAEKPSRVAGGAPATPRDLANPPW
jgi:hypothetical protein